VERRVSSPEFVGRDAELEVLAGLLGHCVQGSPATVVVAGDAGVGKTRLLREFTRRGDAFGACVAWAGCSPQGDRLVPLAPIADVVRSLVDAFGPERVRVACGTWWSAIAEVVPGLEAATGASQLRDHSPAPARAFDLFAVLLERLAAELPLLLVIEDMHWADRSTIDVLGFAARRLDRVPVVLVLSYRTDHLEPDHSLHGALAELARLGAERLDVAPLSRHELDRLLAGVSKGPVPAALAEEIFVRSQGVPFFAEELLAAGEDGEIARLPSTLRESLLVRVRTLPAESLRLLRLLATADRRVDHHTLSDVAGIDGPTVASLLGRAVELHLVEHDGRTYGFRHALVQEAVYSEIHPGDRVELHRRFAAALDRQPNDAVTAAELAHHWSEAGVDHEALRASVAAGLTAEQVFAFAAARGQFERALRLWSQVHGAASIAGIDELELRQHAAEAAHLTGDASRAATIIHAALTGGQAEPERLGGLWARYGRYLWATGDAAAATSAYQQAVAVVPAGATLERAAVLAALGQMLVILTRYRDAGVVCEEAIATARRAGARREEGHALTSLGVVTAWRCRTDDAIELFRRARRIADELGDPEALARADYNLSIVLRGCGRLDEAVAVARAGVRAATRLGLGSSYGQFLAAAAAEALYYQGRWGEAERELATPLRDPGLAMGARQLHQIAGAIAIAQGRFDDAHRHFHVAMETVGTRSSTPYSSLLPWLAELALWQGRCDDGARWAAAALTSLSDGDDIVLVARALALALRAHADRTAARRSGSPEIEALDQSLRALAKHDALPPDGRPWISVALAERDRAVGANGPERWHLVASQWDDLNYTYHAVYARWREAEAWLGRRDGRTRGSAALRSAHCQAVGLGAQPLVARVTELAGRHAIDLNSAATEDLGLTHREAEVLALLAEGHTNRRIANELVIAEKTAGAHVSRILSKLGVTTRGEAAAVAHRLATGGAQAAVGARR
jgi:DNA-binding CsgD family transcriptional regulator/tetratricopeptide (TPR) repeat protein